MAYFLRIESKYLHLVPNEQVDTVAEGFLIKTKVEKNIVLTTLCQSKLMSFSDSQQVHRYIT